ncbi:ER membrane protein complex subunit 10-like [Cynara cardunculus var. scolymus]|uniref:ER membrane protein complex subunit 10-like n=1 Tax=Cynara cardunculus var. scolymus TaxID=59895 RepID=UPI000D62B483|nr:ER membrane protein complex subunit 10-like [Cynara cardunculus var. scolymus]
MKPTVALLLLSFTLLFSLFSAFQSDELLVDDEQFGLGKRPSPELDLSISSSSPSIPSRSHSPPKPIRKRSADSNSDSRVQFALEHAFGDSDDFSTAGTFTARLKTYGGHGTLTKLRFTRNDLSTIEQEKFKKLLENDDFYTIRVPSDVLNPPGRDYVISSVKARCLPNDGLDENFIIHMEGVNILAVNYGSPWACGYHRQLRLPAKWSFNSHAVLKYSEQAPRRPMFSEDIGSGEMGEDEGVKPLEKPFWAKYWMYFIPLVIIVVNAFTQAMNMPEEQASAQTQQPVGAAMQRR